MAKEKFNEKKYSISSLEEEIRRIFGGFPAFVQF